MERLDANAVPDLILLDTINEDSVYKTIVNRYMQDQIYVCTLALRVFLSLWWVEVFGFWVGGVAWLGVLHKLRFDTRPKQPHQS